MTIQILMLRFVAILLIGSAATFANAGIVTPVAGESIAGYQFNVAWESDGSEFWVRVYDVRSRTKLYDSGRLAGSKTHHSVELHQGSIKDADEIELDFYEKFSGQWLKSTQKHAVILQPPAMNGPGPAVNLRVAVYSNIAAEALWERSSEGSYAVAYEISINGVVAIKRDALSFYANNWTPGASYIVSVVAIDATGRRSPAVSETFVAGKKTPAPGDLAPLPPGNLRVDVYSSKSAEILWDRSTGEILVVAYELEINEELIGVFDALSYYASDWVPGETYRIQLVAIGGNGQRSELVTTQFIAGLLGNETQINSGNQVELFRTAVKLTMDTFSGIIASSFISRFRAVANEMPPADPIDGYDDLFTCPEGGTVRRVGVSAGSDGFDRYVFDKCRVEGGLANGLYSQSYALGGRESETIYDFELTDIETPSGYGKLTVSGKSEYSCDACYFMAYEIDNYQVSTGERELTVVGTGDYGSFPDIHPEEVVPSGEISKVNAMLSIVDNNRVDGKLQRYDITVEGFSMIADVSAGSLSPSVPVDGFILLQSTDGSSSRLTASDTPGIVDTVLKDASGVAVSDSLEWTDISSVLD